METAIGLIVGTSLLYSNLLKTQEIQTINTPYGPADIVTLGGGVIVFRHGKEGTIPAHRVSHPSNLKALQERGVKYVIGLQSVGSLKESIPPGSLLVPDDYISLVSVPTIFESNHDPHIVPSFDETIRTSLLQMLQSEKIPVFEQGIYWQTVGPRFETRAEIRLLAHFADCVGMTAASEATVAQEMGLGYCCLCSIDNFAHGIGSPPLTEEAFHEVVKENTKKMETILNLILSKKETLICPS